MQVLWFRCLVWTAAASLSLAMLAVNYGFEAAGSVPDVETCGFLAGNTLSLLIVYPLVAALVAGRAVRFIASRFTDRLPELAGNGRIIGLLGSSFYFACGVTVAIGRFGANAVPPGIWCLIALYIALCAAGGWWAAVRALPRDDELAWRTGRG